jgi:hypothetical protein
MACMGFNALEEISIPSGVSSLGMYCFYGCSNLNSITIKATAKMTLGTMAFSVDGFTTCYNNADADYSGKYTLSNGAWTRTPLE